jgi:putative PIG3 family NAD(P)H quinone oxidoreductase
MKAVIAQDGQPVIVEIPSPEPKADEVLVQVKATALNRADLLQAQGNYPPPPGWPDALGLEFSGEILQIGSAVEGYSPGQRVMALVGGGGYAEQAVAPAAHIMPIPRHLSFEEAAGIPEVFLTAYSNMVELAGLSAGETVLIHAGASGVGLAAIQIARTIGATVIVTASQPKHAICQQYGAELVIDYQSHNFADEILKRFEGVDVVVDMVGAPYWDDNMRVLNKWGRLVFIGLMGGSKHTIDFRTIMQKRLSIMGSTLRNRTYERKARLIGNFWRWAEMHFEAGDLEPVIWRVLPLADVAQAHELMRNNQNAGKIVLSVKS